MKSSKWKDVKVHQQMIYPTEQYGVLKAEVIEIDVKIAIELPTFHYDRPYGLTKLTGVVRIRHALNDVPTERVESLEHLIAFNQTLFTQLTKAYQDWQDYLATANSYKQAYQTLVRTETEK